MKYEIELISKLTMEIEADTAKEAIKKAKQQAGPEYDLFHIVNEHESNVGTCEICEKDIDFMQDRYVVDADNIYVHVDCLK